MVLHDMTWNWKVDKSSNSHSHSHTQTRPCKQIKVNLWEDIYHTNTYPHSLSLTLHLQYLHEVWVMWNAKATNALPLYSFSFVLFCHQDCWRHQASSIEIVVYDTMLWLGVSQDTHHSNKALFCFVWGLLLFLGFSSSLLSLAQWMNGWLARKVCLSFTSWCFRTWPAFWSVASNGQQMLFATVPQWKIF